MLLSLLIVLSLFRYQRLDPLLIFAMGEGAPLSANPLDRLDVRPSLEINRTE